VGQENLQQSLPVVARVDGVRPVAKVTIRIAEGKLGGDDSTFANLDPQTNC